MNLDVAKILIALAALTFLLAIAVSLGLNLLGLHAETFSRASNNLALLAIAWMLYQKWGPAGG